MMVTIGARGSRSSGVVRLLDVGEQLSFGVQRLLISSSQPCSSAMASAMSGSSIELMLMFGGAVGHQLEEQFAGAHADGLGQRADGDRHVDRHLALARLGSPCRSSASCGPRGGRAGSSSSSRPALLLPLRSALAGRCAWPGVRCAILVPVVAAGDAPGRLTPPLPLFLSSSSSSSLVRRPGRRAPTGGLTPCC